jgi:hypothetical protein
MAATIGDYINSNPSYAATYVWAAKKSPLPRSPYLGGANYPQAIMADEYAHVEVRRSPNPSTYKADFGVKAIRQMQDFDPRIRAQMRAEMKECNQMTDNPYVCIDETLRRAGEHDEFGNTLRAYY